MLKNYIYAIVEFGGYGAYVYGCEVEELKMNEFAEVLLSFKKTKLRYRIIQKKRHYIWRFKTRNKPDAF